MCLIAFALNADPGCPLLIAANRDESLDRPTAPLHRWTLSNGIDVVGGRDLRDGGTWLGLSSRGRVAMLTNVRQPVLAPGARSRGELVTRWLQSDGDEDRFAEGIDPAAYAGFNLVVGDFHARRWSWLGNRHPEDPHGEGPAELHRRALADGVYGLSNASLDTPWPKTQRLKRAVSDNLGHPTRWVDSLTQVLFDDQAAPEQDAFSSPFVRIPARAYGTRSSLLVSTRSAARGWRVDLMEWTHDHQRRGEPATHRESLAW